MSDLFVGFRPGEIIGFTSAILSIVGFCVIVMGVVWRSVRIREMECALKQQMLERGMSATEIEQVMRAGQEPPKSTPAIGIAEYDKAALAQRMIDEGYEGAEIERVLKAYGPNKGADATREPHFVR